MAVSLSISADRGICRAVALAATAGFLLAWASLVPRALVMDDYFFFHFLDRMSFTEGLSQRWTESWNFEFIQAIMYRPIAGLVQVTTHHVLGPWAPGHRLLSLLYHLGASVLAGRFALAAGLGLRGGIVVFALCLLQCGAVEAVAWPFSFYDPLAQCILFLALLQVMPEVRRPWVALGLLFLALGCKETMSPMAPLLAAAFWLARPEAGWRALGWPALCLLPLAVYLVARTAAIGHPFLGLQDEASIRMPGSLTASALWTLALFGASVVGGLVLELVFGDRRGRLAFLGLWTGLALAPGIFFSVQITGSLTLLSPRYLYAAMFPLILMAVSLGSAGRPAGLLAGTAVLALIFPRSLRFLSVAGGLVLVAMFLGPQTARAKLRWLAASLGLGALASGLWHRLEARRLQAAEAGTALTAFESALEGLDPRLPVAVLGLTQRAVEPNTAFNGDLQWALQRPFLSSDLDGRLFAAYPRWDSPPTNRYADLGTPALSLHLRGGGAVEALRYEPPRLVRLGTVKLGAAGPPAVPALDTWGTLIAPIDPSGIQAMGFDIEPERSGEIWLGWRSERQPAGVRIPLLLAAEAHSVGPCRLWIPLGDQVDWLLAGSIQELELWRWSLGSLGRPCPRARVRAAYPGQTVASI